VGRTLSDRTRQNRRNHRPLSQWTDLTPQERQVAHLVAGGATNREAAASLFVNLKTIEFHLGNIYRKLGVRSRTELANALWRRES
jgi:DNA-binding CsgD family transcriptional regulator